MSKLILEAGAKVPRILRWQVLRRVFGIDIVHKPEIPLTDPMDQTLMGKSLEWYSRQMHMATDRLTVYREYDEMDFFDIVSTGLDTYVEDGCSYDSHHKSTIWIESDDEETKKILMDMFKEINIEELIPGIARNLAKKGDAFEQIMYNDEVGVFGLNYLPPEVVGVVPDDNGKPKGFELGTQAAAKGQSMGASMVAKAAGLDKQDKDVEPQFQPWDILHFKVTGNRINNLYGDSLLRPIRRIWKQLKIMEDATIMYRIQRSPDRLAFYLDVGAGTGPVEAMRALNQWRTWFKKRQYYDPSTGEYRAEYNPMALDEDLFIPTSKESATKIDKLQGSPDIGPVLDLEYFRNRVFGGLRIPKAYLGHEEGLGGFNPGRTLLQQDIRYARTIKRLQRGLIVGFTQLCRVHLALLHGKDKLKDMKFRVLMAPVSYLDELQKSELWAVKMDMAQRMAEVGLNVMQLDRVAWLTYILSEFVGLPDRFIEQLITVSQTADLGTPPGGAGGGPLPPELPGGEMAGGEGGMGLPPEAEIGGIPPEEIGATAPSMGILASDYKKPLLDVDYKRKVFASAGIEGKAPPDASAIEVMRSWWDSDSAHNQKLKQIVGRVKQFYEQETQMDDLAIASLDMIPLFEDPKDFKARVSRVISEDMPSEDEIAEELKRSGD